MSTRVCGRCRRPLPAASEGAAPAPCPFCAAQDAGRAGGRAQPSRSAAPREDAGAPKKRAEAFASALSENATRTTPVHSFAVPPEAIPVVNQPRRRDPPPPTPPPVVLTPPPAPVVTILPPSPEPQLQPPPAPPPRRAAAVTATLASLGPGPFTPQARSSGAAAAPAAAAMVAAFAELPIVAPSSRPAAAPVPYLVPVPTPTPAPVAAAPVAKAAAAASLAETMLAFSASPQEAPRAAPPEVYEAPRASALASAASPAAARGADAWNISSYIEGAEAPPAPITGPEEAPVFAPAPGTISEPPALLGSEPVDFQIRGGLSALLHRLSGRGFGVAAAVALLVVAISVGAFVLLGGSPHSGARKLPDTRAATSATEPRVAAAPAPRLPSLVMPSIADPPAAPSAPSALRTPKAEQPEKSAKTEKAEKPAKIAKTAKAEKAAPAREPELAPPPVEKEAPRAPAPARSRAHVAAKSKAASKHAAHHASSGHGASHRRTTAHASATEDSAPAADDSDKMARAREAYREGNEKLFSGDAAGAITAYEEMVRLNPKDPAGYRGLGLASAQLGKRTEAVRYLRAYLKHAPNADDRAIIISRISLLQTLPP